MANDTATSTDVGKWLIAQGAEKYAAAFFSIGCKDIVALKPDVIRGIVTDDSALANKLAEAIDALSSGTTGGRGGGPTGGGGGPTGGGGGTTRREIPEIPSGTAVDLTLQKIAIDNVPPFSIPRALSVEASNATQVNPTNISKEDWMILARMWDITRAYTNTNVLDENGNPEKASKVASDWVVPTGAYFSPVATATVESEVAYSEATASFVKAGFDKETASSGCDFAAASFER
jgi:hypothetical protein